MKTLSKMSALIVLGACGLTSPSYGGQVYGHGRHSCADYTKAIDSKNYTTMLAYRAWMQGFISALNAAEDQRVGAESGDVAKGKSWVTLETAIEKRCKEKPLEDVMTATIMLLFELKEQP